MQSTHLRYQLGIYGYQVALVLLFFAWLRPAALQAQMPGEVHLPNFDEQRMHYGFLIGMHSSRFILNYSEAFGAPPLDTLHSILPTQKTGFKVGFIFNLHVLQYLDLRLLPTFSFFQLGLDYRANYGDVTQQLKDPTYFELPLLLKYKSVRRRNRAIYLLAGINPSFKVSGGRAGENASEKLLLTAVNLSIDVGVGLDLFQPLFKFSPEVRYSFGLSNVLSREPNKFSTGIARLAIHSLTFYVTFEGGPTSKKRRGRRQQRRR